MSKNSNDYGYDSQDESMDYSSGSLLEDIARGYGMKVREDDPLKEHVKFDCKPHPDGKVKLSSSARKACAKAAGISSDVSGPEDNSSGSLFEDIAQAGKACLKASGTGPDVTEPRASQNFAMAIAPAMTTGRMNLDTTNAFAAEKYDMAVAAETYTMSVPGTDVHEEVPTGAPEAHASVRPGSTPGAYAVSHPPGREQEELQEALTPIALPDPLTNGSGHTLSSMSWVENSTNSLTVAAEVVEDSPEELRRSKALLEEQIRKSIISEAVEAEATALDDSAKDQGQGSWWSSKLCWILSALLSVLTVTIVLAVAFTRNKAESDSPNNTGAADVSGLNRSRPTLEVVQERGKVKCGVIFQVDGENVTDMESINIEQCLAISIAVFGTSENVEIVKLGASRQEALAMLADHHVDVLTALTTHSMSRDVFEPAPETGYSFAVPYVYISAIFAGDSFFVDCAENLDGSRGDCRDLKICTFKGTLFEAILNTEILRGTEVVTSDSIEGIEENLNNGVCNVAFADRMLLPLGKSITERLDFKYGTRPFSREACGCTTRQDDTEWTNLVSLVINTFYSAEGAGISKSNAFDIYSYLPENEKMASMLEPILAELGNYGDIASKGLLNLSPRQGLNRLYDSTQSGTGLLASLFLGNVDSEGPGPLPERTLEKILDRDRLLCGVRPRPGFATLDETSTEGSWVGFDVEFCRAVAAALMRGGEDKVTFVNVSATNNVYTYLDAGEVDLVAGARVTLEAGFHEPTTGKAYSFSMPYFYSNDTSDAFALMTRQDDPQFSDFVYWIVNAVIDAEEHRITASNATEMPIVFLFGGSLKQMFIDCVAAVGSYADMYRRNLESVIPRGAPNILNDGKSPQQFPIHFS